MIGVYEITIGDYYYFGSAKDCEHRCVKEHFASLKNGTHGNKKMQSVYNKHKTFDWQIVENCDDRGIAYLVEQAYLDANVGRKTCMNLSSRASAPPLLTGKQSNEHIQKRFASLKGFKHEIVKCAHCGKTGGSNAMSRWHGDKCKHKKETV